MTEKLHKTVQELLNVLDNDRNITIRSMELIEATNAVKSVLAEGKPIHEYTFEVDVGATISVLAVDEEHAMSQVEVALVEGAFPEFRLDENVLLEHLQRSVTVSVIDIVAVDGVSVKLP